MGRARRQRGGSTWRPRGDPGAPLPLSSARTRPGGPCVAVQRPDGTLRWGVRDPPGRGPRGWPAYRPRTMRRILPRREDFTLPSKRRPGPVLQSCTTGNAGGMKDVNRSKRLGNRAPPKGGATHHTGPVDRDAGLPLAASGCTPESWPRPAHRWTRRSRGPRTAGS